MIIYIITGIIFLLLNLDIIKCLINPTFFIPLENQSGQTDIHDIFKINMISLIKILILNFLFPFGLAFYYLIGTDKVKNKVLLTIMLIYLLVFLIATPLHHVSIRLLILPLVFTSIYFFSNQRQNI